MDMRETISSASSRKLKGCRSFHFRYLELCRAKNLSPLHDVRSKNNVNTLLEFCGDKLGVTDWLLVNDSLCNDLVLQTLDIRMRKACGHVLKHVDSEKKARLFKQKPVIYTKFIFNGFIEAICNCIELNKNLKVLHLEGLPLAGKYMEQLAKALSCNESVKDVSLARSNIKDEGCEAICNTVKYLENVENLNLSDCDLTTRGADYITDLIKIQKINRYTEGWQKSLRYRDVDPDSIPGLRCLNLARNPKIGDDGVRPIIEILKDDVWIKIIDLENCGLSDISANSILDCLEVNIYIHDVSVRNNPGMSKRLQRSIREALGKDDEELLVPVHQERDINTMNGMNGIKSINKIKTNIQHTELLKSMEEQLKNLQEQLALERVLRKKAEILNDKLNQRIQSVESQLEENVNSQIPEGYVIIKNEILDTILSERDEYKEAAAELEASAGDAPRNGIRKMISIFGKPRPVANIGSSAEKQTTTSKIRKVKSEIKYMEPAGPSHHTLSKSDHEFANDKYYNRTVRPIETNIGDTSANVDDLVNVVRTSVIEAISRPQYIEKANSNENKQFMFDANDHGDGLDNIPEQNEENNANEKEALDFEVEKLSLSSRQSFASSCDLSNSNESDTLRNVSQEYNPIKVFISRSSHSTLSTIRNGEKLKSPRTLFLGCN